MEDNSPYQASKVAPAPQYANRLDWRDEPPREITSPIKHMWILLTVMGSLVVLAGGLTLIFTANAPMFALIPVIAVGAMYLLGAFGVYKRSRIAATLVLCFCGLAALGSLIRLVTGEASLGTIGFIAVLSFVSIRGTLATYRYHRHLANVRTRPARARLSDDPAFAPKLDA